LTQPPVPALRGERVTLRPVTDADRPRLLAILDEPEVARWWRRDEWERLVGPETVTLAIEVRDTADAAGSAGARNVAPTANATAAASADLANRVIGMIQFEEEADPDYRSASIDIFISTAVHSRGLGRDAVRTLARYLMAERGHHRITMDPAANNERAVRSYAAVGFRPVGVLRRYERVADGSYRDALLMELIAEDFGG
jgi:aminoglycoside 6'-N-acetyltransferase